MGLVTSGLVFSLNARNVNGKGGSGVNSPVPSILIDEIGGAWSTPFSFAWTTSEGWTATPTLKTQADAAYMDFGQLAAIKFSTGARSIDAWVSFGSWYQPENTIYSNLNASSQFCGWALQCNRRDATYGQLAGLVIENVSQGKQILRGGGSNIALNTKYHMAMTYGGSNTLPALYVNGSDNSASTLAGSAGAWNTATNAATSRLFARSDGTSQSEIQLYALHIWDRELSASEVLQNYNAGSDVVLVPRNASRHQFIGGGVCLG